jgi:hypothetical protein
VTRARECDWQASLVIEATPTPTPTPSPTITVTVDFRVILNLNLRLPLESLPLAAYLTLQCAVHPVSRFTNLSSLTSDMAPQSTDSADLKPMTEVSMLTIVIQAAAAIKNRDGDPSLHGYMDTHGLISRREMYAKDVDFVVLDSVGDTLMLKNQVLAICPDTGRDLITILTGDDLKAESDLEIPADDPINDASEVLDGNREGDQSNAPLGNIKQVLNGKSMWAEVKKDPFTYAVQ